MLTRLKKRFQLWIASDAKLAHNIGFTPNHVSATGMLFAIFSGLAYWNWQFHQIISIMAPILLLVSGFCDALDGAIARIYAQTSTFGGFFDSLLDRYADGFVLCGIILGGLCHPFWGLAALMGSLLVSYVRARAESEGIGMESVGLTERAERLLILVIASFLSFVWLEALSWGIVALAVLANLTVLQRVIHFYRASHHKK
ncbi:MAG: CDP-alcohol phosphatidyltransferase family protein [Candidatus Bathyarchaeota archaeon]|nr:MAG: CDP-alcohol phosphatidyltransferase family protein [Candidatus Bathyarchaeota archaeon]